MRLTFYGGAQSVTGANYLLETKHAKILIDCGLEQGSHFAERKNFEPFPYRPDQIDAVLITHAHIDHTGRIPKLYKDGFRGRIFSTDPTRDFAQFLLLDSEHILSREAEREKRPPLYEATDVEEVFRIWEGRTYHESETVGDVTFEFFDAGHVLGSAIIRVKAEGKAIVFSGDLGNFPAPIIKPTETIGYADYCLIESTYGDRVHEGVDERRETLEDAVEDVAKAGGTLMIPAFALERTQELLYHLHELFEEGRVPPVPVFVDSPLAIKLTAVYKKYERYFNKETINLVRSGDDILNFPGLHLTLTTEESKSINGIMPPKVIIAGSGMSHGGRIIHHEHRYLSDPNSMILFVGYQARGSLGREILEGARRVKIFGEEVLVRCKSRAIGGYSAHADQPRLLEWLMPMRNSLKRVFVVQGEEESSGALAQKIRDDLALDAVIPKTGDSVEL